ncbi:MAG: SCP2 sterol-binding domain-containing protein [Candidatus Caenarcaniphilales bacterium]|nr:SCP2 sterol-binding domain-containing protein [Candidatus Caenarcaniphilales bacterium]
MENILETLVSKFNREAAADLKAVYAFKLDDQSYGLKIDHGEISLIQDLKEEANVTFESTSETWREILSGQLAPQMAFMQGKLTVSGDMPLALRLSNLFGF